MSRIRANKITNKVGTGAIELEKGAHLPVGMGITGAGAINISGAITGGVITGSSFSGDGSGLIGVASTDNIITGTAATFNTMPVDINAGMTVAGVSTFGAITATSFGAVSGTTGTFSGNVSVGGVLTYEDVTNVDSVGIITARSSIKVTNASANSGNFLELKTNADSSSDIIKAGAGAFFIKGNNIFVGDDDTNEVYFGGYKDNYSFLNYNGATKIRTEAGGVFITGVCSATSYTGDGSNLTGIQLVLQQRH